MIARSTDLCPDKENRITHGLFALILGSIFLAPLFNPFPQWFAFRMEDVLLPLIIVYIIVKKEYRDFFYSRFVILFMVYILLTILFNNPGALRDYLELYKLLKYLFYLMFFMCAISKYDYKRILEIVFYIVFAFNLLHYFDILNFNKIIEPFYTSEFRLLLFGKNSLGEPDTKRMLGTMGNPNNNAIMFLFFAALFAPAKLSLRSHNVIYYLSFTGVLLTQSRTGMVAFIVLTIANIFIQKFSYKSVLKQLMFFVLIFIAINLVEYIDLSFKEPLTEEEKKELLEERNILDQDKYLPACKYLTNVVEDDRSEKSISGRLEVWKMLWGMIKERPLFGHGPSKDFFYENKIYPESEYVLMTWRYGFFGLFLYISLLLLPLVWYIKGFDFRTSYSYLLFLLVVLITALMNNPCCEPRIMLMIAFMNASFFNQYLKKDSDEKAVTDR